MARMRQMNPNSPEQEQDPYAPNPNGDVLGRGAAEGMGPPIEPDLMEIPPIPGRSSESPRERIPSPSPSMPSEPTPQSGQPGGSVFTPMGPNPVDSASLVNPRGAGGLYGSMGGLKGGGLGVPFDPVDNASEDSISALIQMLMGGMKR